MARWRKNVAGAAETESGAVLVAIGVLGLLFLRYWGGGSSSVAAGYSIVVGFMFAGVLVIGACLVLLGGVLWLIQRSRDKRIERLDR